MHANGSTEVGEQKEAFRPELKSREESWRLPDRITVGFNVALLAFHAATSTFQFMVSARPLGMPLSWMALWVLLDTARYLVVALIAAWFVRSFWRRLISPIFSTRFIGFQEAVAIVLMVGVLVGR
jgi:hypothetical protein